jgi:hypothetical protein
MHGETVKFVKGSSLLLQGQEKKRKIALTFGVLAE